MAQSGAHGHMDIQDQRNTFNGFIATSLWGGVLLAQLVALLVLAFATGNGWSAGLSALVAIGVAVGFFFRMSATYWAVQIVLWVLLVIGGLVAPALAGMMA
jgi:CBS domain containing-hemolysin-like protein